MGKVQRKNDRNLKEDLVLEFALAQQAKPLIGLPTSEFRLPGLSPMWLPVDRPGRQQMDQLFALLVSLWEIWMERLAPAFSLMRPWLLQIFGGNEPGDGRSLLLSLPFSLSFHLSNIYLSIDKQHLSFYKTV